MLNELQAPAQGGPITVTIPEAGTPLISGGPSTAQQNYQAAKAAREVLQEQWQRLRESRSSLASSMRDESRSSADLAGLEKRLNQLDERIIDMEKQIQAADLREAQAAGTPGAIPPDPPYVPRTGPDWDAIFGGGAVLSFALLFPFVIAYSRRIWRRSAKTTVMMPPEVSSRMQAMEDAIESVAVEVERIGEGQRFMTQALSAGGAEAIPVRQREAAMSARPL